MSELAAAVERVWPGRDARSRCSAAGSRTTTSRSRSTASVRPARRRQGHEPARDRPHGRARGDARRRPRSASAPRWSRSSSRRAGSSRASSRARSRPLERMREPEMLARVARALRAFHDGPPIPGRFDSFRVVETYRETALARGGERSRARTSGRTRSRRGSRRIRGRRRAEAVPQRPPERELPRRRRAPAHRRLGVRGDGRCVLRPRELLDQPRARRRSERVAARGLLRRDARRGRRERSS